MRDWESKVVFWGLAMANYIRYVEEDWHKNDNCMRIEVKEIYYKTLEHYREVAIQKRVAKTFYL